MKRKVLFIIAHEGFYENELFIPLETLTWKDYDVFVASTQPGLAKGSVGGFFEPHGTLSDVTVDDFEAVALIGGLGVIEHFWNNHELHELLREAVEKDKIIGSICASGVTLAKAGILRGGRGTTYPDYAEEMAKEGVEYVNEAIVVWGRIVMGRDPLSSKAYGETLCALLEGTLAS